MLSYDLTDIICAMEGAALISSKVSKEKILAVAIARLRCNCVMIGVCTHDIRNELIFRQS